MISRGIATFIGGFALVNLAGSAICRGFDANLWWIDFNPLPPWAATAVLLAGGTALLAHAFRAAESRLRRFALLPPIGLLAVVAIANTARFYLLRHRHMIAGGVPLPFSALVFFALAWVIGSIVRPPAPPDDSRRRRRGISAFAVCIIGFPLAQMYFFGHTDYRRKADVIVVFGARAYADGSPSGVLADRVATACRLYRDGLAHVIVFSGGPGDGAVNEPEAMRRFAIHLGVPDSAIRLDPYGLNTDATVRNTDVLFRRDDFRRILAVSHSYHLPRIKMAYRQKGWEVYTVPAVEHHRLPGGGGFQLFREMVAMWALQDFPKLTLIAASSAFLLH